MSRIIPNWDKVGNDCCLSPMELDIPMIIVDNGGHCFWFHQPLDQSAADQMVFALMNSTGVEAFRVDAKVVLPSATDVRAATDRLDLVQSDPVRVTLRAD